jgi:hypothetical protein
MCNEITAVVVASLNLNACSKCHVEDRFGYTGTLYVNPMPKLAGRLNLALECGNDGWDFLLLFGQTVFDHLRTVVIDV